MPTGHISKNHSRMKIIALCLGIFALLILISALCLPMFFSTTPGKKMLTNMINKRMGLDLKIDEVSLSWFGSQSFKGIHAQKKEDQLTFTCQEIATDASLLKLAIQNDIGHLKVTVPDLQINKPFLPTAHLRQQHFQSASFAAAPGVELGFPKIEIPLHGQVIVEKGKVSFNPPELEPIAFNQIALSLDLIQEDKIGLVLNCTTTQKQGQGQIAIKGSASSLNSALPNFFVQSTIAKLPMRGIDQLVSILDPKLSGLLLSAIGDTVDLQCNINSTAGNIDISLNAQSPQMAAQIATQSANGILSLKTPGTFNFTLTPALLQKLAKLSPALSNLSLSQPALFQMALSQFSCPLPANEIDLLKASFQASVLAPSQFSMTLNGKPLVLNKLALNANSSAIEKGISINAAADLHAQGQIGSFALNGTIALAEKNTLSGNLSVTAAKLPVDLIGAFVATPVPFSALLGPFADLNCSLDMTVGQPKAHFSWQSDYLNIAAIDLSLNDPWTLISPASFSYGLSPQLITALFPDKKLQLVKADPIQGTIKNLVIPENIKNTRLDASVDAGQISFSGDFPLVITKLQALLAVNTLDQISLTIDGAPLQASVSGALNLTAQEFTLNKPLIIQYTVDNALLQGFSPSAPQLIQPAVFSLSVDPLTLNLSGLSIAQLKAKGQLSTKQLALAAQPSGKQISLQNLVLPFQWNGKEQTASLQLSSQVQNPAGEAGSMQGQFNLSQFSTDKGLDFTAANVTGTLDLQNISSAFLDAFSGNSKLSAITGASFSSKMKFQSTVDKQNIALKWMSPFINVDSAFIIDNASIQLQGSSNQITWTLTPESYKALDSILTGPTNAMVPFEIKEASTFTISLSKMLLPVTAKPKISSIADRIPDILFDLNALQLSASGNNPKMLFYDKSSQEIIQLSALIFSLNKSAAQAPLSFALDSTVLTQGTAAQTSTKSGSLSLSGKIDPTLTSQGTFDPSQLTGNLQLKVQQLPARALDILARAKGRTDFPFTTIFGNLIDATLSLDLKNFNGPVSMNVNAPLTRASLSGTITNGALTLNDSIYAQVKITPEISRLVLKEVNPLNLSYIYSEDPVTLEIPATKFYFPLYPSDLEKIAIPEAKIELGKVSCRNEGNVNIALGLLKTKQFEKSGELMLWFAPLDLKVEKGTVHIDRTEILLSNTFDVCLWGTVDLLKDYVDMVLGLTAQTLSKAFGIKNLPEKYVLTIPMKGPADNVQINTGKATAKVALLLAWQQKNLASAIGGGPAGAIVGELLKKVATLPDSGAKVPPAKHPFPWEVGQQPKTKKKKTSSHEPHEKMRHFKQNEKPLKQILKVIK